MEKIVNSDRMTRDVDMVMYGGRGLEMFFKPLFKISMVVMDREEYIQKSEELLNQPNYKILQTDPTTKFKNKLISILKSIKSEGGIDENTYKRLYPTEATPPKYYGLPKIH